uniref:Beta-1,4-N-acetylgalactosaminyltransferase n=1 Tax=Heterorhabditis bacteriophora TaxID=37862 RepID=A0A1I7WPH6_HETBA
MLRECYYIWRNISPKRLIFLVIAFTTIYVTLLRSIGNSQSISFTKNSVTSIHRDSLLNKTSGDVKYDQYLLLNRKVFIHGFLKINTILLNFYVVVYVISFRSLPVMIDSDPKELENARQTLTFLTMTDTADSKQKTTFLSLPDGICPEVEMIPDLLGALPQAVLLIQNLQEAEVEKAHPELLPGGHWTPNDCKARYRVAIIIPYRDRQSHLTRLIDFLIPILQRQRLNFRFIVTEQVIFSGLFYILKNIFLLTKITILLIIIWVLLQGMNTKLYIVSTGKRILSLNYTIERPNPEIGRYSMLKHVKRERTAPKLIYKLLEIADQRVTYDGLNETDKWEIKKVGLINNFYNMKLITLYFLITNVL